MAESLPKDNTGGPGVLYFDPNPTTAKLATAGLRLAGYRVFNADSEPQAVDLCRKHGPAGDGSIVAILLDTATSPPVSSSVLKALVQVPGADELPGILLVSRANLTPIPGAEELPSLKRPFTTPALLKILRETIDNAPRGRSLRSVGMNEDLLHTIDGTLRKTFPSLTPEPRALESFVSQLVNLAEFPKPTLGATFQGNIDSLRLESVLQMLAEDGARGVLTVTRDKAVARLHIDRGRLLMAEAHDTDEDLRLGRFIVEAGFMESTALEAIVRSPDPKRRPLGIRLVEEGHVQPEELGQALLDQSRELTCHLLTWDRGQVSFAPATELHPLAQAAAAESAGLRIADALLEGLRRVDEQAEMGPQMAGVDEVWLRVDEEVARRGRHAFTREELAVLELLNGRNSVKEIARKTRTGTFAVSKLLYRLSRANLARRRLDPVQV